jgi:hypothetical protein
LALGLVLAIGCITSIPIAHTHFADADQEIHFLKNMAMTVGCLHVPAAFGIGA